MKATEKQYISLNGDDTKEFYEYMVGVLLRLEKISKWAQEAWLGIEECNDIKEGDPNIEVAQMKLDAIQYLAESMGREVDLSFVMRQSNSPLMELEKASRQVNEDKEKQSP